MKKKKYKNLQMKISLAARCQINAGWFISPVLKKKTTFLFVHCWGPSHHPFLRPFFYFANVVSSIPIMKTKKKKRSNL